MTTEAFREIVKQWLATAKDSRFQRLHTELVYQPMLEVMDYLRTNGFKTYIVTGGGQEFVRVYSQRVYGISPEQVVGSSGLTKYEYAYGPAAGLPDSKVGTFSQALFDEAKSKGWTVISMKKDWKHIFAFEK